MTDFKVAADFMEYMATNSISTMKWHRGNFIYKLDQYASTKDGFVCSRTNLGNFQQEQLDIKISADNKAVISMPKSEV